MTQKIWVLTREHNEYDQHGCYFVTAWLRKPTHEELIDATKEYVSKSDVAELLKYVLFLEKGGGRQDLEGVWYNLDITEHDSLLDIQEEMDEKTQAELDRERE